MSAKKTIADVFVPLTLEKKALYGMGDFASNITWQIVKLYLLFYFTDVFGITAAEAGIIFLVSRIWDAVFDPVIGYITDHTRTRWGRFRPYLLFCAVPLGIVLALIFTTPDLGHTGKFIYAFVLYLMLVTLYSLINLPYASLTAAMTQDTNERNSLAGFRMLFAVFAGITVAALTIPLVNMFPTKQIGYRNAAMIYSAIATVFFFITFFNTKERVSPEKHERYSIRQAVQAMLSNKPLIALSSAVFFMGITGTMAGATALYFIKYNLGNENLYPIYAIINALFILIGVGVSTVVSKRIGKRNMFIIGIAMGMAASVCIFFTPWDQIGLIFAFTAFGATGGGAAMTSMWSMAPDTVEYAEWKHNIRAEGLTNAAFAFVQKLDAAIGGAFAGAVLAWIGYVPNAQQTQTALNGILYVMTVAPLVTGILAIICLSFYKLDAKTYNKILDDLRARKAGKTKVSEDVL